VQVVQILEQQLAYTTAEVTQAELQRAVARADALVLSERLRAFRPDSGERVRELGEQLASTTAAVARLERQLAVSQELVVELTERVRVARAFAGL
jgi:nicotinic acid phosphoribosyltransferase